MVLEVSDSESLFLGSLRYAFRFMTEAEKALAFQHLDDLQLACRCVSGEPGSKEWRLSEIRRAAVRFGRVVGDSVMRGSGKVGG